MGPKSEIGTKEGDGRRWDQISCYPTWCHTSEGKQNLPSKLGSDVMCLKLCLSDNYAIWVFLFETTSCLYFVLKLWHGMVLTIVQTIPLD